MPSSSFVEIDIANNEAPIIDNHNVVITSEPRDPPEPVSSSPHYKPKVSQTQSQDDETVVSPTPRKMKSVKNNASDDAKVASANDISKAVVTPRAKSTATKSSPLKGAVATPGTSAKKEKKKGITLDSFFSKGKKQDVGTKLLINTSKAGVKIAKKGERTNHTNDAKIVEKKCIDKKTPAKKSNTSKEIKSSTAGRGKRSVLESVGEEKTIAKSSDEPGVVRSKKMRVIKAFGTANNEKNAPVDSVETKEVVMKDVLAEPDDDKTVDLDQGQVPDTSYNSSSEQSLASEVDRMEVVVDVVQVDSPSPMKSSDEESNDAVLNNASKNKGPASKSTAANDPKELGQVADSTFAIATNDSEVTGSQVEKTAILSGSTATVEINESVSSKTSVSEVKVSQTVNSTATVETAPTAKSSTVNANLVTMKETPKPKLVKSSSKASTKAAHPAEALSKENSDRMEKYTALRERYVSRAVEVASRSTSDDFEEETLSDEDLPTLEKNSVEVVEDGGFPDELLPRLLILVQGRYASHYFSCYFSTSYLNFI